MITCNRTLCTVMPELFINKLQCLWEHNHSQYVLSPGNWGINVVHRGVYLSLGEGRTLLIKQTSFCFIIYSSNNLFILFLWFPLPQWRPQHDDQWQCEHFFNNGPANTYQVWQIIQEGSTKSMASDKSSAFKDSDSCFVACVFC